ncbi:MAG: chemotaxis protein methyltransferase [Pseudomonadota bacterium]|jgi:type IV pilus assembly protein PilK
MIWSLQAVPDISDQEFALWSKLLEERAGIYLSAQQRTFLQTQVVMRMRELGLADFSSYYQLIVDGVAGMVEWSRLIDRLVVKETSFFRHMPSYDFVASHLSQQLASASQQHYEVWSVGCSTGEEPYSLAMILAEGFGLAHREPLFGITATDISRAALSLAKNAVYTGRKLDFIAPPLREKYLTAVEDGRFQIIRPLRERICFNQANLLDINEMPAVQVDLIYCQNLLIYFRRWLREKILNAFVQRLKPGGALVIGLGEVLDWSHPSMQRASFDAAQAYIHK